MKKIKAWVGIVDDKLHFFKDENYYDSVLRSDLFKTKKDAKKCYEKVLKVKFNAPS